MIVISTELKNEAEMTQKKYDYLKEATTRINDARVVIVNLKNGTGRTRA